MRDEPIRHGDRGATSPDAPTHEATTPPGNPPEDEQARERAEEELRKPGAGH